MGQDLVLHAFPLNLVAKDVLHLRPQFWHSGFTHLIRLPVAGF